MNINNKQHIGFDFTKKTLILGLGLSGYSCVRYLITKACPITVSDTRNNPPLLNDLQQNFADVEFVVSEVNATLIEGFEQIVVSPGISSRHPDLMKAKQKGILILGDIALFLEENQKQNKTPIIAVTGSNGKSTVVTLIDHITKYCGLNSLAGGNLGLPALDLLEQSCDVYVLELSSFQLETIPENTLAKNDLIISASVLNVSEDHMDRYDDINDYRQTKETIYQLSQHQIVNKEDSNQKQLEHATHFTQYQPNQNEYGLVVKKNNNIAIVSNKEGIETIWGYSQDLKLKGLHNYINILSALALIEPLNLNPEKISQAIKSYTGLPHRCEWVKKIAQNNFYNDSKGTNVGATIAAINSFDDELVLIAGGVGKDADFDQLSQVIVKKVQGLILIGRDAPLIKKSVEQTLQTIVNKKLTLVLSDTLKQAVEKAKEIASRNATILFSPACASFDMFKNYNERGEAFVNLVEQLALGSDEKSEAEHGMLIQ